MPTSVGRLEPERMSDRDLWRFIRTHIWDLSRRSFLVGDHRELMLQNVASALEELYMRGQQLHLATEPQATAENR